jgi:hypothetical protein
VRLEAFLVLIRHAREQRSRFFLEPLKIIRVDCGVPANSREFKNVNIIIEKSNYLHGIFFLIEKACDVHVLGESGCVLVVRY